MQYKKKININNFLYCLHSTKSYWVTSSIYADQVATSIGWTVNSGFQIELGFASIGIGLVGFLSFKTRHTGFRLSL